MRIAARAGLRLVFRRSIGGEPGDAETSMATPSDRRIEPLLCSWVLDGFCDSWGERDGSGSNAPHVPLRAELGGWCDRDRLRSVHGWRHAPFMASAGAALRRGRPANAATRR